MFSSASDKASYFAENFSKSSYLDASCISLPVFLSRANLKLSYISVTPKMAKKLIKNLDLSKASGSDCIPVVVLKNCKPELFNKCLKESFFQGCCKGVLVFNNFGERSTAKNYDPVSLLSVVSNVFEKFRNNRIFNHLETFGVSLISRIVLGLLD